MMFDFLSMLRNNVWLLSCYKLCNTEQQQMGRLGTNVCQLPKLQLCLSIIVVIGRCPYFLSLQIEIVAMQKW